MFEKHSLHVRLRNASVELVLSWLDKWNDEGKYNLVKEDEKILLNRQEPLLDAALSEYSSETQTLSEIYFRGELSLKKACLKNDKRGNLSGCKTWPYDGTFHDLLNKTDIENGLLKSLVTNPSFDFGEALDVFEKKNEYFAENETLWLQFISLLSRNSLMQQRLDFGDAYEIQSRMWQLSQSLTVTQENVDYLYNLYFSLGSISSDDPKQIGTDFYEFDRDTERNFLVEKAINRWASFNPRDEDKVRQGFFLIKGHSGAEICRFILKNLKNDTQYFAALEQHEEPDYRQYFYKNAEFWQYEDDGIAKLNSWFEKDGNLVLEAVLENDSAVFSYDRQKWVERKIKEVDDTEERRILELELSNLLDLDNDLPAHLRRNFEFSSLAPLDARRVDRLERQVDLLFKNLLGVRNINDDHMYLEEESSLSIIAENLGVIKYSIGHFQKKVYVMNKLIILCLILNICVGAILLF